MQEIPYEVHGETIHLVRFAGEDRDPARALRLWRSLRAADPTRYPVLVDYAESVTEPDYRHDVPPAELIERSLTVDLDAYVADDRRSMDDPGILGSPDDDYLLDGYGITGWGEIEALVLLPTRDPWAAFAYLNPYASWTGLPPELFVAAARRWHERYGAEPTLVGLATGFEVAKQPAGAAEALDLAVEHVAVAGLTARNTLHGYARSLRELDHWCLYNRP
jgi:hypothetical protein